jgi:hypothetical protein
LLIKWHRSLLPGLPPVGFRAELAPAVGDPVVSLAS